MVEITREDTPTKARYVARVAGIADEGELTLSKVNATLVIADHTSVPDSMRGKGVGVALFERLIADARAAGQRIIPLCPFVKAQVEKRRAELADVIEG